MSLNIRIWLRRSGDLIYKIQGNQHAGLGDNATFIGFSINHASSPLSFCIVGSQWNPNIEQVIILWEPSPTDVDQGKAATRSPAEHDRSGDDMVLVRALLSFYVHSTLAFEQIARDAAGDVPHEGRVQYEGIVETVEDGN